MQAEISRNKRNCIAETHTKIETNRKKQTNMQTEIKRD
jgi:hypothetical protein